MMDLSNEATKQALMTGVRIIIAAIGALLVKYKLVSDGEVQWVLTLTQDIVGVLMIVVPAIWEIAARFKAERKTKEREAVALNVGIRHADATVGPTPPVPAESAQIIIAAITASPPQAVPQVGQEGTPAKPTAPALVEDHERIIPPRH